MRIADPQQAERLPPVVVALANDYPAGHAIAPHSHRRAQLIFAERGVMTVTTEAGAFVVPPHRAVWMPAGTVHRVESRGVYAMRTLLIRADAVAGMPPGCRVVTVSPLLREVILALMVAPQDYPPDGPVARLAAVALDRIRALPVAPLHLPRGTDRRLRRVTARLLADPSDRRDLGGVGARGRGQRAHARAPVHSRNRDDVSRLAATGAAAAGVGDDGGGPFGDRCRPRCRL